MVRMNATLPGNSVHVKSYTTSKPWSHGLTSVPRVSDAGRLAAEVRAAIQPQDPEGPILRLEPLCRAARVRVIKRDLGSVSGGAEAVLVPQPKDRFHIWVDPTPRGGWQIAPTLRVAVRRHRLRFRVAHEIAHTLFYRRNGGEPDRLLGDSPQQERFADEFARALLVPPALVATIEASPQGVLDLQRLCDVSLEVALRALVASRLDVTAALTYWPVASGPDQARVQWMSDGLPVSDVGWLRASAKSLRGSVLTLEDRCQQLFVSVGVPAHP